MPGWFRDVSNDYFIDNIPLSELKEAFRQKKFSVFQREKIIREIVNGIKKAFTDTVFEAWQEVMFR